MSLAVTEVEFAVPDDPRVRMLKAELVARKQSSRQAMARRRGALTLHPSPHRSTAIPVGLFAGVRACIRHLFTFLIGKATVRQSGGLRTARRDVYPQRTSTLSPADRSFPRYTEGVVRKTLSLYFARLSRARMLLYRTCDQLCMLELDAVVLEGGVTLLCEVKTGLPASLAAFRAQNLGKLADAIRIAGQIGPTAGLLIEAVLGAPAVGNAEAALGSAVTSAMSGQPGQASVLRLSRADVEQLGRARWICLDEFVRRGEEWRRQQVTSLVPAAAVEAA